VTGRRLTIALSASLIAVIAAVSSAGAQHSPADSGLQLSASVGPWRSPASITVSSVGPAITAVTVSGQRDVAVGIPGRAWGSAVGVLVSVSVPAGHGAPAASVALRLPRHPAGPDVVLHRHAPRVVLHLGTPAHLGGRLVTLTGLPLGTSSVRLTLRGRGAGLVGLAHPCPATPTFSARVTRVGTPPASVTSSSSCR